MSAIAQCSKSGDFLGRFRRGLRGGRWSSVPNVGAECHVRTRTERCVRLLRMVLFSSALDSKRKKRPQRGQTERVHTRTGPRHHVDTGSCTGSKHSNKPEHKLRVNQGSPGGGGGAICILFAGQFQVQYADQIEAS